MFLWAKSFLGWGGLRMFPMAWRRWTKRWGYKRKFYIFMVVNFVFLLDIVDWNAADRQHLGEELSDVLIYLIRLAGNVIISVLWLPTCDRLWQKAVRPVQNWFADGGLGKNEEECIKVPCWAGEGIVEKIYWVSLNTAFVRRTFPASPAHRSWF